eukprot:5931684-Amphidinium_carterae.1
MATTTLSGVVTTGNTVKRDAGHLDALNVMHYEDSSPAITTLGSRSSQLVFRHSALWARVMSSGWHSFAASHGSFVFFLSLPRKPSQGARWIAEDATDAS